MPVPSILETPQFSDPDLITDSLGDEVSLSDRKQYDLDVLRTDFQPLNLRDTTVNRKVNARDEAALF